MSSININLIELQSKIILPDTQPSEVCRLALSALECEIGDSLTNVKKAAVLEDNPLLYTLFLLALDIQKVNTAIVNEGFLGRHEKERAITSVVIALFRSPHAKNWVHSKSPRGLTPLHYAVRTGKMTLVDGCLLIGGAEVDAPKLPEFATPLHFAICSQGASEREKHRIITRLLECGADKESRAAGGFIAFDYALQRKLPEKILDLLRLDKVSVATLQLCALCNKNDSKAIKLMKVDPKTLNSFNPMGFAPLHVAAESNAIAAVRSLIWKRADIHIRSHGYGLTPVHVALIKKNWGIVNLLLERGAVILKDSETLEHLQKFLEDYGDTPYMDQLLKQVVIVLSAKSKAEYIESLILDPQNLDKSFVDWFRNEFS